jgi:hypothetical protein
MSELLIIEDLENHSKRGSLRAICSHLDPHVFDPATILEGIK